MVGATIAIAGVLLLVHLLTAPRTVTGKLVSWIGDAAQHTCLGGDPSHKRITAAERPDVYPDLLGRARSAEMISCDYLGESALVVYFSSPTAAKLAFAHSRSALTNRWCVVGSTAFNGDGLSRRHFRRFCRKLGGTVRPARS